MNRDNVFLVLLYGLLIFFVLSFGYQIAQYLDQITSGNSLYCANLAGALLGALVVIVLLTRGINRVKERKGKKPTNNEGPDNSRD